MTGRPVTVLLAALLAVCGAAAVPPSRAQQAEACPIVWIAEDRTEVRAAAEPAVPAPAPERRRFLPEDPGAPGRLFSPFLYERPPPALV